MHQSRIEAVRSQCESEKIDALVVTHLPHVRWLSGFSGSNAVLIITPSHQILLTDGRYKTQAPEEAPCFTVQVTSKSLFALAAKNKLLRGCRKVGIQSGVVSIVTHENLRTLFPSATFVNASGLIEGLMAVKEEYEIVLIRDAVRITDDVFSKIIRMLKPGVRELEIAAEITYLHRTSGADGDAFEPIVASGVRGALPHARASEKKIRRGEFVTLDFGCRVNGYCSDLTRTVAVGSVSPKLKKVYRTVLEAQEAAIAAAAPGVAAKKLDRIARRHISQAGFGRYFTHSLGHGVGLEIHEPLRLSAVSKDIMAEGNVVTVEPGIYIPDVGGVRIEDDIVLRHGGCEILNRSPKELLIV